jgi:UDP-galactopyranose mutase
MTYDYAIIGAGLSGATFAERAVKNGKRVLVIDKREHVAGNCYTSRGFMGSMINVHQYGPHIFHTSDKQIWEYVNHFALFNGYVHSGHAIVNGEHWSLPINMATMNKLWGVKDPDEAMARVASSRIVPKPGSDDCESWMLSVVGRELYELLFKEYTTKQWGKHPSELPSSIFKRLPIRFTWNDRYYNDTFQGIPVHGYTSMIEKMLQGACVVRGCDYAYEKNFINKIAKHVVYTGPIDAFFEHSCGKLEYRSLHFEHDLVKKPDFQGTSVINYPSKDVKYTRIIEHVHFDDRTSLPSVDDNNTVITYEYPCMYQAAEEPFYPVCTADNLLKLEKYQRKASEIRDRYTFLGRLGTFQYLDMDDAIYFALKAATRLGMQ